MNAWKKWIFPAVILAAFLGGAFVGYCTWGPAGGSAHERLAEEGRRAISGLREAQQGATGGVSRVQGALGELTEGAGRSIEGVGRLEGRIGGATDLSGELSDRIERGIGLATDSRERIDELDAIIRELIKRDSLTDGPGE